MKKPPVKMQEAPARSRFSGMLLEPVSPWSRRPAFLLSAVAASSIWATRLLWAQATDGAAAESGGETLYSLVLRGGWLMVPIALASVVALTVAIERLISLRSSRTVPGELLERTFQALPGRNAREEEIEEALALLEDSPSLLSKVLEVGVRRIDRDAAYTEAFMEEAVAKEAHLLERRLRPFAAVAQLAPLLGLLGTIYGMITCFGEAAQAESASRAETLARGIYSALVTTAAGLTVAIPSLVLLHYFQGKVDRVVDQLEEAATEFLDHYYGEELAERRAPARTG